MTLFILTETSAGYALLKAKDKKLLKRDDLSTEAETAEGICSLYVDFISLRECTPLTDSQSQAQAIPKVRQRSDSPR